jgi:hypothetical protein
MGRRSALTACRATIGAAVTFALLMTAGCADGTPASSTTGAKPSFETSTTITTLAPGVMTFKSCLMRFETLIDREMPDLLPYSVMPAAEVAWLFDEALPFDATDVKGYRFENGDMTVLFFLEPLQGPDADEEAAFQAADTRARAEYPAEEGDVWVYLDGDFGYVVVSTEYRQDLGRYAQWARQAHQALIDGQ